MEFIVWRAQFARSTIVRKISEDSTLMKKHVQREVVMTVHYTVFGINVKLCIGGSTRDLKKRTTKAKASSRKRFAPNRLLFVVIWMRSEGMNRCIVSRLLDQFWLRGLIHSLVLVFSLHALAWARVEQHLLDLQHSRSDRSCVLNKDWFCKFCELDFIKCFGQYISKHYLSRAVNKLDFSRLDSLTWEVVSNIGMLCSSLNHIILCNFDASLIILINWSCFQSLVTKIFKSMTQPNCFLSSIT